MAKKDKSKRKVPNLRFPGFEGEWEEKKLADITEKINSGKTPLGGESIYMSKGIIFIRSQNVNNEKLELENPVYISEEVNATMKNSVVKANDVLLNITGASLGRSCVVPDNFEIGNVNQHVCIIRLKENYNPRFIQPIFSSSKGQSIFESLQTGSGREGLNFDSIKKIKLKLPKGDEQLKIASFLSLLDRRIQTQNKIIEKLETLIKGLCQKLILSRSPNRKLKDCVSCHSSSLTESDVLNRKGIYPVYGATGIISFIQTYQINEDAILIIKDGAGVGRVYYGRDKFSILGTLNYLTPRPEINLRYIFYCLKFFVFEKYRVGSGIPHIYFKDYGESFIYCPSMEEQSIIADSLLSVDEKISIEKKFLQQIEIQKKHLLQNLFI